MMLAHMEDVYEGKESSFYTYGRPTPPLIMVIDRYILLSPLTYSILVLSSFIEDNAWFKCGGVDILVLIAYFYKPINFLLC